MRYIITMLLFIFSLPVFAGYSAACPSADSLAFTLTTSPSTGYFSGQASDGTFVRSDIITIPDQFLQDGYTKIFDKEESGNEYIACGYHLLDNVSQEQTFTIFLSSTISS